MIDVGGLANVLALLIAVLGCRELHGDEKLC